MNRPFSAVVFKPVTLLLVVCSLVGTPLGAYCHTAAVGAPISNCTQLQEMKNNLSGAYYLTNDIDCSETSGWNMSQGWEPVGSSTPFTGTLDGQGFKITNLYMERGNNVGLFGYVDTGCRITRVGLENVAITGQMSVGGLVGGVETLASVTISHCYVTGSVQGTYGVGGLAGLVGGGSVSHCYSTAYVQGDGDDMDYVGGLIGALSYATASYCFSTGGVNGGGFVGGLVGASYATIDKCFATGPVYGNLSVGGLVGENVSTNVNQSVRAIIRDSYARGRVVGAGDNVGGLVGRHISVAYLPALIRNSYSSGEVTHNTPASGGLVGATYLSPITEQSYWDTETSTHDTSQGGTGMKTAAMKLKETYAGWDFRKIWTIQEGHDYPVLRSVTVPLALGPAVDATGTDSEPDGTFDGIAADAEVVHTLYAAPAPPKPGRVQRAIFEFTLPSLPDCSTIDSARLYLHWVSSSGTGYAEVEDTAVYGYGGDGAAESSDFTETGNPLAGGYGNEDISLDVTAFIRSLVEASTYHAGFLLARTTSEVGGGRGFSSMESSTPSWRPVLSLSYTPQPEPNPPPNAIYLLLY